MGVNRTTSRSAGIVSFSSSVPTVPSSFTSVTSDGSTARNSKNLGPFVTKFAN